MEPPVQTSEEAKPTSVEADKPVKEEKQRRYEVSLQKPNDKVCFVRVAQSNTLQEAKERCVKEGNDAGRECIVWDNEAWDNHIVFRHQPKNEVTDDKSKEDQTVVQKAGTGPRPKHAAQSQPPIKRGR